MDFSTYICEVKNSTTQKISSKIIDLENIYDAQRVYLEGIFTPKCTLYVFLRTVALFIHLDCFGVQFWTYWRLTLIY